MTTPELSWSRARIDALADDIAEAAAHVDAATHRLLSLIRSFDRARGWHDQGALSCAHWLSWRIGLALGPAREKLRVAHALADLPRIDDALRRGELSYSKVRAMTRVASVDNEVDLLSMARQTTAAQLERICRLLRQVRSLADADPRRIEEYERRVVAHPTDDGLVSVQLRLLPDEAARVMRAIQHCAAGGPLADGAVALAETALAGATADDDEPDRAMRPPIEVVLHVSADNLAGRTELGDGVPAETSRRLLCDAGLVLTLDDAAGNTIDVGRKTRTIPTALRRALWQRDHGCRYPELQQPALRRRPPRRALDRRRRHQPRQHDLAVPPASPVRPRVRLLPHPRGRRAGLPRFPRQRHPARRAAHAARDPGLRPAAEPAADHRRHQRARLGRPAGRLRTLRRRARLARLRCRLTGQQGVEKHMSRQDDVGRAHRRSRSRWARTRLASSAP